MDNETLTEVTLGPKLSFISKRYSAQEQEAIITERNEVLQKCGGHGFVFDDAPLAGPYKLEIDLDADHLTLTIRNQENHILGDREIKSHVYLKLAKQYSEQLESTFRLKGKTSFSEMYRSFDDAREGQHSMAAELLMSNLKQKNIEIMDLGTAKRLVSMLLVVLAQKNGQADNIIHRGRPQLWFQ